MRQHKPLDLPPCPGGPGTSEPLCDEASRTRPLHEIAVEIQTEWRSLSFAAVAPVAAMRHLRGINDEYRSRGARAVVRDFLGNATEWRGAKARKVKAELKDLLAKATD